jgi:hypothetical protein
MSGHHLGLESAGLVRRSQARNISAVIDSASSCCPGLGLNLCVRPLCSEKCDYKLCRFSALLQC